MADTLLSATTHASATVELLIPFGLLEGSSPTVALVPRRKCDAPGPHSRLVLATAPIAVPPPSPPVRWISLLFFSLALGTSLSSCSTAENPVPVQSQALLDPFVVFFLMDSFLDNGLGGSVPTATSGSCPLAGAPSHLSRCRRPWKIGGEDTWITCECLCVVVSCNSL